MEENEYSEYKEQFMSLTPKEAVDNAYELIVKQEIFIKNKIGNKN